MLLSELLNKSKKNGLGPVVLFPEGITTNGNVLIGCLPAFDSLIDKAFVHVFAFSFVCGLPFRNYSNSPAAPYRRYEYSEFSPSFPAGNFLLHLWYLCGQVTNKLTVKHIIDADLPAPEIPTGADTPTAASWAEQLYSMLASANSVCPIFS